MALLQFFDDDLFSSALRNFPGASNQAITQSRGDTSQWTRGMALDVKETPSDFQLTADIPGVQKGDIKVNVQGDILTISVDKTASKEETKEEKGVKYHRQERSHNFARRSVRMPETADLSKVSARYQDGVLHLTVHKMEEKHPKNRQIQIEG